MDKEKVQELREEAYHHNIDPSLLAVIQMSDRVGQLSGEIRGIADANNRILQRLGELNNKQNRLEDRVSALENARSYILGALFVIGTILAYFWAELNDMLKKLFS